MDNLPSRFESQYSLPIIELSPPRTCSYSNNYLDSHTGMQSLCFVRTRLIMYIWSGYDYVNDWIERVLSDSELRNYITVACLQQPLLHA